MVWCITIYHVVCVWTQWMASMTWTKSTKSCRQVIKDHGKDPVPKLREVGRHERWPHSNDAWDLRSYVSVCTSTYARKQQEKKHIWKHVQIHACQYLYKWLCIFVSVVAAERIVRIAGRACGRRFPHSLSLETLPPRQNLRTVLTAQFNGRVMCLRC